MKALQILEKNQSTKERASEFIKSIKRNLKKTIIDDLEIKIEKIEDKIYGLKDMSVSTDMNQGVIAITRDQAEERFNQVIEAEYELYLLKQELKVKKQSFNKYFDSSSEEEEEEDDKPKTED